MRLWIASAVAIGIAIRLASAQHTPQNEPDEANGVIRQLTFRAAEIAARSFEDASLYLNSTTLLRRDRLASIEMMSEFPSEHPLRKLGASIGMLLVEMEMPDGSRDSYICTASLIRPGVVITNQHCIANAGGKAVKITLWLNHTKEGDGRIMVVEPRPLESDAALDYALLRPIVAQADMSPPDLGAVAIRAPSQGERLFVIHHAKGNPQQVSRAFCRVQSMQPSSSEIGHTCPTNSGSSGALIFAEGDGAIVGLHHSATKRLDAVKGYATPLAVIQARSALLASNTAAR